MKHIGIVAGAALCYRTICLEGAAFFGPHEHRPCRPLGSVILPLASLASSG